MNQEVKIKLSLGRKIFLSVLSTIILMVVIIYSSTTRSISEGLEAEMKVRGTSISKNVSSSLSTILSSIIAEKIAINPKLGNQVFEIPEIMSQIFSELKLKEEYINLIETFSDIPRTEDIMWATAVDINGNILIHSDPEVEFMSKFILPKDTFKNSDLIKSSRIIYNHLKVRKLNFFEKMFRGILPTPIEFSTPISELEKEISKTLKTDNKITKKLFNTAQKNIEDNLKNTYEKFSTIYWQIKSIQRKYNQPKISKKFREELSKLVELLDYNYITLEVAEKYISRFQRFLQDNKESILKEDYLTISVLLQQFMRSSFGITGFLQYYEDKGRKLLFSYPVLIKDDFGKYVADLYIGMSTESIDKTLSMVERQVQVGALIAIIVAVVIVIFLSTNISKGARIITSAMKELSKGNLNVRANFSSNDEIGFIAYNFNIMVEQIAEKEKMRDIMNKVVSEEIAKELLSKGIELGGETRFTTMLFSDIRGFTSMSENMDPRDLISILNEYMTEMVEIVKKYKGVVDKFVGDEIMVVYGAPISLGQQEDALLAVATAYEMLRKMEELHIRWQQESKPLLTPGIGINSGNVVAGNMGSKDRLSYTVIGDAVNTAARLCGSAPGKTCIMSRNTYMLVKDFVVVEEKEPIQVKGKSKPLEIYSLVSVKQEGFQKIEEILSKKST